ncbi:Alpha/beta hydrolase (plasmid) [Caballeronia sp. S22]
MSNQTNTRRRRFLSTAIVSVGAMDSVLSGLVNAQAPKSSAPAGGMNVLPSSASFFQIRQVDAGVLNVGYADVGQANNPVVILLHGWPYDIHSFVEVAPRLVSAGYRVIVPYLRGYGTTRFISSDTARNAQQSVLAVDVIALMDALKIDKAIIGGFDWGARSANVVAALWPERCKALVSVSGYLIGSQAANIEPLPPKAEFAWWYQFYFATERGKRGYETNRHDFAKLIWQLASPKWSFDDATFERSARAFLNPDHVEIAIDNYRWRLGLTPGEPQYDEVETRLAAAPVITVPTITLEGDANGRRIQRLGRMRRSLSASTHTAQSLVESVITCRRKLPKRSRTR